MRSRASAGHPCSFVRLEPQESRSDFSACRAPSTAETAALSCEGLARVRSRSCRPRRSGSGVRGSHLRGLPRPPMLLSFFAATSPLPAFHRAQVCFFGADFLFANLKHSFPVRTRVTGPGLRPRTREVLYDLLSISSSQRRCFSVHAIP